MKSAGAKEIEAGEDGGGVALPTPGIRAIPKTGAANQMGIDDWQGIGGPGARDYRASQTGVESMATATEIHAGEPLARKRAAAGFGRDFRNHRTLRAGILYLTAIIAVLAVVGRL